MAMGKPLKERQRARERTCVGGHAQFSAFTLRILQLDLAIDTWLLTGRLVIPQLLIYLGCLIYMHPKPWPPTESLYNAVRTQQEDTHTTSRPRSGQLAIF